ncbi:sulfurtransferase [Aneurinibacillus aneurinilyticus]|jgi:thiosulfate/3-mercaptopyruvate sulfurtransferase|uniref:Sulfurtransferase n=2 Tax=Aneurinibacillus aneurinilyticus TaxID=1391 RepID=A0A848CUG6_ANEAE|nr:sulfurtransferase [Aneurinibacillus aneurinilyticus]ERI08305.1 rhodanese-like protein [Aneurinibacillus aneurinilyticus ATCC 12856]MCI1692916.1 sulfurtransferase [Aneurinibacillus aneurinilyticus]MED0705719.1 sulfurtransferase [Aneurinibacillus aneurinilyticus]MED0725812.1 sulfurtransferase [Aneurinibacillus aneurinilyticus]MED0732159.1 sulfurtransferase [Aneurinibacillus aneurinilyticus]
MDTLVSASWLKEHLYDANLAVADCRFVLGSPDKGREAYEEEHIPGARYFDLEKDLSAPKAEHGGRHPWPQAHVFASKLGGMGIGNDTSIILYDAQGGAMAARAYWVLKYIGHKHVALLDGGYGAWKAAEYPVTHEIPAPVQMIYEPHVQEEWIRSMEDVRQSMDKERAVLIDSRAHNRYTGEAETIDPVGGHIPGAVNYDWQKVIDENGKLKDEEALRKHFAALPQDREVIVYCGSGVTACANLFALERLGYKNARLYPGSWSDWITYEENKIAKDQE